MTDKKVELNDDELEQVRGGWGYFNGVEYNDGDAFISAENIVNYQKGNKTVSIIIVKNTQPLYCDIWTYDFDTDTRNASNGKLTNSNTNYFFIKDYYRLSDIIPLNSVLD